MADQIPTREPETFVSGDSWEWDKSLADYPAGDGWQLSYRFVSEASDDEVDATWATEVTADGDAFEVRIPEASSATTAPGPYMLYGRVNDGTTTRTVFARRVLVLPNVLTVTGAKSHNRTMRDALRTAIQGAVADSIYISVSVNGRTVEYARTEADSQLAHYEYMVALEENPHGRIAHAVEFVRG